MQYLYSLPHNELDSENDQDDEAEEELQSLEMNSSTISSSSSKNQISPVDNQENLLLAASPPLHNIIDNEYDEEFLDNEEWGHITQQFDNVLVDVQNEAHSSTDFDKTAKEIDYFKSIFGEDLFQIIISETNTYAVQNMRRRSNKNLEPGPSNNWEDISRDELQALFDMMIIMRTFYHNYHVIGLLIHI